MSSNVVKGARPLLKNLKPVLSSSTAEAKKRVLSLYKLWYRQVPYVVMDYDVPITVDIGRRRLRQEFDKNKHLSDIRAIDLLVVKGQMELVETAEIWKQRGHIMNYFMDTVEKKQTDFMSKFYNTK